ncbi:MAG TPA: helix-turn-helix domain-containing protein [Acidimicrobiales bacterium]|jgi:AcrR family transcriptional regulator|nr:helix-turn-helix domain-containing protein [Acidimicrobiales bacterium]
MRADARRNRQLVLAAADEAFAAEGIGVPIDDIARRAGVGAGTLYRHFPTKESLFEAVLLDHVARLVAEARNEPEGDEPAEALFAFMSRLSSAGAARRDLIDALAGAGINVKEPPPGLKADIEAVVQVLLKGAQKAGQVRNDVTAAEIVALTMATCAFAAQTESDCSQTRMLHIVCEGLRPRPSEPES